MVTPDVIKATIDETLADVRFLRHLYNNPVMKNQVSKLIKGATRPRVSLNEFFGLILPLPCLAEQREIAAIVDSFEAGVKLINELSRESMKLLKRFIETVFI